MCFCTCGCQAHIKNLLKLKGALSEEFSTYWILLVNSRKIHEPRFAPVHHKISQGHPHPTPPLATLSLRKSYPGWDKPACWYTSTPSRVWPLWHRPWQEAPSHQIHTFWEGEGKAREDWRGSTKLGGTSSNQKVLNMLSSVEGPKSPWRVMKLFNKTLSTVWFN